MTQSYMGKILLLFLLVFFFQRICAQTPDWSSKIAGIIYDNCSGCHHEGNIGPFPLMSYDDAVTYGFSVQEQVNAKKMPPWPADPEYNHFWGERVLSDDEIAAINDWVNGGMPSGDLAYAPVPPVFDGASIMVNPDDTVLLPAYTITSDDDVQRTFVVHSGYSVDKFINAIEFVPGDLSAVHHVIFNQDTSDIPWQYDQADPGPGYETYGLGDPSPTSINFGGWNPGRGVIQFPPNMGFQILAESDFVISVHYAPGSFGKTDSSKINIKFCDLPDSAVRRIYQQRFLFDNPPVLQNPPLFIEANTVKTFYEISDTFVAKKSMLGLAPHSHYVCSSWEVYMINSDNDTTRLLKIPQWNFDWQYSYLHTKVVVIPSGAQLYGNASFDNTVNNPDNPNNPPLDISEGQSSDHEMMNCRFWMMDYEPGDEEIILDSAFYGLPTAVSVLQNELSLQLFPNPAKDVIHVTADLPSHEVTWYLYDAYGKLIQSSDQRKIANGIYVREIDVRNFPAGIHFFRIQSGDLTAFSKVVIVK